jgi:dipeptidyl aminopeptidase/acylaminoacyl peptidase
MPKPTAQRPGRPHLHRDNQQWIFDYVIQQTGRTYHFQSDGGGNLPKSVRSHAMISKHLGKQAISLEGLARNEAAAGHQATAAELYYEAAKLFMRAQHPIFELNDEKRLLYAGLRRTYDKVRELSRYRIERVDVPWNGTTISGWLHLNPEVERAPLLLFLSGCDVTCETWPNPGLNEAHHRGMHVFSLDGPGQGQSNMRGIRLTADNYEDAASTVLDHLVTRPEIDADKIAMLGTGGGSLWGMRVIAHDPRIKAGAASSTFTDPFYLMDVEVPRWKQLFAFLTQAESEEELDAVMAAMALDRALLERITCPTLMVTGEFDQRDPIDEVYELFDYLKVPAELWVFADQLHLTSLGIGGHDMVFTFMVDWLADRLAGKPVSHPGEVLYLESGAGGPNSPTVGRKRKWYESLPAELSQA